MIARLTPRKEVVLLAALIISVGTGAGERQAERMSMIDEIQSDMKSVMGRPLSPAVADALKSVERHRFVPGRLASAAYQNRPLPIGRDQTISQPFIVALMTELMEIEPDHRVLEIGTGSGYQAAVLAELCQQVYSIEIIAELASDASARLRSLGYINVSVMHGDGTKGWPAKAPFDSIVVTAAGVEIPDSLIDQLKPGGRLVMPVGEQFAVQELKVIRKTGEGISESDVLPVRFVPITHELR
jgi:protein-L-isoaspartate(D-aspartate) O-methyltransferase